MYLIFNFSLIKVVVSKKEKIVNLAIPYPIKRKILKSSYKQFITRMCIATYLNRNSYNRITNCSNNPNYSFIY